MPAEMTGPEIKELNDNQPSWWGKTYLQFIETGNDGVYLGETDQGKSCWVYDLDKSKLHPEDYIGSVEKAKQVGSGVLFVENGQVINLDALDELGGFDRRTGLKIKMQLAQDKFGNLLVGTIRNGGTVHADTLRTLSNHQKYEENPEIQRKYQQAAEKSDTIMQAVADGGITKEDSDEYQRIWENVYNSDKEISTEDYYYVVDYLHRVDRIFQKLQKDPYNYSIPELKS